MVERSSGFGRAGEGDFAAKGIFQKFPRNFAGGAGDKLEHSPGEFGGFDAFGHPPFSARAFAAQASPKISRSPPPEAGIQKPEFKDGKTRKTRTGFFVRRFRRFAQIKDMMEADFIAAREDEKRGKF